MSDINLIISATDSASPVLKRINKQVDQFNRNAGRARASGATLGTAFRGLGAAAAAIGFAKIVSGTVSTIAKFESLKASLKTVTGSADGARVAFAQIQQFTAQTPFQLDEVTNAFTILKRNGIDTSMESLEAFGNIAAANGKSFEQLAEAIADGMTGEFERLKEFGIKVRQENGRFIASMGDTQVAASGSATQLMNDLRSLGEEGGRYASGLADQAATLGGKFSNLQDNMSQFAASIGEGGLNSALKDVLDSFNGLMGDAPKLGRVIGAGLGAAINVIMSRFKALFTLGSAAFNAIAESVTKEGGLADKVTGVFQSLKNNASYYLAKILDAFGISFNDIPRIAKVALNFVISSFQFFYESAWKIITKLPEIFKQVFIGIGNLAIDFGRRFVTQFQNLGEAASLAFQAAFSSEISFSDALAKATENAFSGFDIGSNFNLPTDVFLTQEDANRIYGTDYFEIAKDLIVNSSDEVQKALGALGITVDGFQPGQGAIDFMAEFNRLTAEGVAEEQALAAALEAASAAQDNNTTSTNTNNTARAGAISYAKKLRDAYKDLIATVTKTTEQDRINADLLPQINKAYSDGTLTLGQYSEALTNIGAQYEPLAVKAFRVGESIKQSMAQAAGQITDVFFNMFTGVTSMFDGLKSIAKMVLEIIAKAVIQAFIVKPILAAMGIPMFANGGIASAGQPAIVGENGPELIVPNRDSRIVSNSRTNQILSGNGQGSNEQVNVNFTINAIDTRSGVEFLIQNKSTITGVVQQAFNSRGRPGPMG